MVRMSRTMLPSRVENVQMLDDLLSTPTEGVVETLTRLEGDWIVLGVAGKMGPSLAAMVKRASDIAGVNRKVIGVSRFGSGSTEGWLAGQGIQTIRADLLNQEQLNRLPDAPNVV